MGLYQDEHFLQCQAACRQVTTSFYPKASPVPAHLQPFHRCAACKSTVGIPRQALTLNADDVHLLKPEAEQQYMPQAGPQIGCLPDQCLAVNARGGYMIDKQVHGGEGLDAAFCSSPERLGHQPVDQSAAGTVENEHTGS